MAAVVALAARDGGGPLPAMQLLIYPVTDSADDPRSRSLFADGFMLTKADMDLFERAYLPDGATADDPRVSILGPRPARRCRPPTSPPPGSTRCATRARPTRCGCARPASPSRCAATRGLIHGFANRPRPSAAPRAAAMLEAAGALRMGLAP